MPSLRIRTYIFSLCIITVYLSTVEGLNIIKRDASDSDYTQESQAVILQLLNKLQYRQNDNEIRTLGKLLHKINDNEKLGKRDLRDNPIGSVQDFLFKLKNFVNQNTHNNYYKKRADCRFGFGPPGSHCKKNKFRRHTSTGNSDRRRKKKDKLNYAQHMLVERARYKSSSESNSDEDRATGRQKSRFQIVDNARSKKNSKGRNKGSSENQDDYDDRLQMERSDDSDEQSSDESDRTNDHDAESDEPRKVSGSDSSVENDEDEKYFYLQGSRLQRPNFRGRARSSKKVRRNYRSHFMPKRYKWDDKMLTHLDEYWKKGIQSYGTYRQKYVRPWPFEYYK